MNHSSKIFRVRRELGSLTKIASDSELDATYEKNSKGQRFRLGVEAMASVGARQHVDLPGRQAAKHHLGLLD